VQWARAAERDQRELARIVPALDRDDAQRPQHLRVHDLDDLGRIKAFERALGGSPIERYVARQLRGQPPEQQVRIGDGRPSAAPPIAGGPRLRGRALGADSQCPARVPPDERAAAGADGVKVDSG
jgi:hypothetical protein